MKRTEFCVRQVVYHLCSAEMWQELFAVVSDVEWLLARAQLEPLGLVLDLEHAAAAAAKKQQKQQSESWDHHSNSDSGDSDSTQHLLPILLLRPSHSRSLTNKPRTPFRWLVGHQSAHQHRGHTAVVVSQLFKVHPQGLSHQLRCSGDATGLVYKNKNKRKTKTTEKKTPLLWSIPLDVCLEMPKVLNKGNDVTCMLLGGVRSVQHFRPQADVEHLQVSS